MWIASTKDDFWSIILNITNRSWECNGGQSGQCNASVAVPIRMSYPLRVHVCHAYLCNGKYVLTENVPFEGKLNTSRPRHGGRHFADDIFEGIFLNENVWIPIKISLKFVPKGPINNIPVLVQIMVRHRPGVNPLSEPMMVTLLVHICVTRPQWVNQRNELTNQKFYSNRNFN